MRSTGHSQAGFSLIELMVAVVVMGVVTAQLFIVMGNQKKVYSSNERAVDTQETARMTLDLISFDTRMGGYMVPTWTAVSSVDGGTDKPDRFCVSSMFADPGITGDPNKMRRSGSGITALTSTPGASPVAA
jgi:prepilin-type N-terminal cleavage/methylation domain-containing protein